MSKQEETKLGTPRSESWDTDWFRRVDMLERDLDHRICGAHAPDFEPCQIKSKHKSGRCRFHGGHPRIGGQKGNRNAVTHGLYSRKLRQCGDRCPTWDQCPYAADDVMELPVKKRPLCFYERRDYDRMMDAFNPKPENDDQETSGSGVGVPPANGAKAPSQTPYALILNDTTALLYTMLNRAAAALTAHDLTEETTATGANYTMKSSKVSAIATAFLRIGRELQAHLKLRHTLVPESDKDDQPVSLPGLMKPIIEQARDVIDEAIEHERNRSREDREAEYGSKGAPIRGRGFNPGPETAPG